MFDLLRSDNSKMIDVNSIDKLIGKVELIDIREPYEYSSQSIKTAKNIPMGDLLSEPEKYMSKDKTYYILCQSGARSDRTSKMLTKQGYIAINVVGGMGSYSGKMRK